MTKKIDNPKVFISYAWGDDDYQNQVLALASQLVNDGIDVVLDKWDLTEGNDTFAFMEKCVTDSAITNVLMLLDPIYAKKADEHTGGVGVETQIISAKVYKEVEQDKFIPVIMKRDPDGKVCKPAYLEGRLHFDLSVPEDYAATYSRLVKKLYGEAVYAKPELGKKPTWVGQPLSVTPKSIIIYDSLRNSQPEKVKAVSFTTFLDELSQELSNYTKTHSRSGTTAEDYIALYDGTQPIRDKYLTLLKYSTYVNDGFKRIAGFFESSKNSSSEHGGYGDEIAAIRLHEMFVYTIAYFLKTKDFSSAGYLLTKTYFPKRSFGEKNGADSFHYFYSGSEHTNLDRAICNRDKKQYFSGTGTHWIETLASEIFSQEEFVFADLICFNYSVYGRYYENSWYWFPITYIYDNKDSSIISGLAKKLISRENTNEILPLFGHESIDSFVAKFKAVEQMAPNVLRDYRYSGAFESAAALGYYIKSDSIATLRQETGLIVATIQIENSLS